MPSIPATLHRRETIVSAVLYLMTKHAQSPCPLLGRAVAEHLNLLARCPADDSTSETSELLCRLAAAWRLLANDRPSPATWSHHRTDATPVLQ